ncbi:MAG TPA: DUF1501 domain-containing protein [Planctomycetaceae bacterium]|nr:DUF1501 domain-containing protein [Planctomycetaceae bacterium]
MSAATAAAHGMLTRRGCLQLAAGVWCGGWARRSTTAATSSDQPLGFGRAKSVLYVVANGGQSQIDIWDPKPDAPREIRGDFASIATSVPGTRFGEHIPRLAQLADRFALIRSMSHEDLDHGSALYLALTGQYHARRSANPPSSPTDWPTQAAVVKRLLGVRQSLDAAVHLNGPAQIPINIGPGQNAGFLGSDFDPLLLGDVVANETVLPGLEPLPELPGSRRDLRQSLLDSLEQRTSPPASSALSDYAILSQRAHALLDRPEVQHAFDLYREKDATRRRYGLDRSGQSLLLARRLVEAGVPWITIFWNHTGRGQDLAPNDTLEYGWDTHNDIFSALKTHLLPRFDLSFSALLEDLSERGLLSQTLVVCAGEFGRAPIVALEKNFAGESPGRKHWSFCYSAVAAGAGVTPGLTVGASDSRGAYPITEKHGPWDLSATMFSALGLDPSGHFTDRAGRPTMLSSGRVIESLYGG